MKKLRSILPILILGVITAMTMASCIDSDDNNQELTEEQKQACVTTMSGSYSGKIFFMNRDIKLTETTKTQTDSTEQINARFSYPESAVVIYDIPAKLFFKELKNHDEIKQAAENADPVDLKIKYVPYSTGTTTSGGTLIDYYMQPNEVKIPLTYGGETHEYTVMFLANSLGRWIDKETQFSFYIYGISTGLDANGNKEMLDGNALYNTSMTQDEVTYLQYVFYGSTK